MPNKKIPLIKNGIVMWRCCTCKQYFKKNNFYKDKKTHMSYELVNPKNLLNDPDCLLWIDNWSIIE
jgi:hypothetical protein